MVKACGTRPDRSGCRGAVTVEFVAVFIGLLIPTLVALAEVYRVAFRAQFMMQDAQAECIQRAANGNRSSFYRVLSIPVETRVEVLDLTRRLFPDWDRGAVVMGRTYHVGTGTGME